ncbi:hypothetical protein [Streptomyces lonarensis]|uniref:Uncharacterized protein n=1 Tax=Streptomyces lonarensis TaxID=700599 RepID=A0A7X6CY37_9ACTN|nr:hypothetical protein [Streptomyces lonarensis]NJQ04595.1 hypothetical protein [Streptomyces lonarensis]
MDHAGPTPYIELDAAQSELLAQLVRADLPAPDGTEASAELLAARGLDPDDFRGTLAGMPLGTVRTADGTTSVTALGAAVHYRARAEQLELLLSRIGGFAARHGTADRRFAACLQEMAQETLTPAEAESRMRGGD